MMLRRLHAVPPVARLRGEMDRLFSDFMGNLGSGGPFESTFAKTFPPLNIWEDEQNVYAEAEVPGMKMDNLEVLVSGNELTIKGERVSEEGAELTYHRRERGIGTFTRVLHLPVGIDSSRVEASLHDGVLTITLPKAEASKPRKIAVKSLSA